MLRALLVAALLVAAGSLSHWPRTSKSSLQDVLVKTLILGLAAGSSATAVPPTEVAVILVPGYKLPPSCYSSWLATFQNAGFKCHCFTQADQDDALSVSDEAVVLADFSRRVSPRGVVLVGHSKGGAVCARATPLLSGACKAVLLVDPVDDSQHTALSAIASNPGIYPRTLIVSCPYGGNLSKYYKASLESACAPSGRNADAFYRALSSAGNDKLSFSVLEGVGHLQLLDQAAIGELFFANMCAANADISVAGSKETFLADAVSWLHHSLEGGGKE